MVHMTTPEEELAMKQRASEDDESERGVLMPPCDRRAEAAVVADVLLKPQNVALVRGMLAPADLFDADMRRVLMGLYRLHDDGSLIDEITVANWLRERGWFKGSMVTTYGELFNATPAVTNVVEHARIVVDLSKRRKLIAEMQRRTATGYGDVGDDPQAWYDQTVAALERIASEKRGGGALTAREAAEKAQARRIELAERVNRADGMPTYLAELDELTGGLHLGEVYLVTAETGGGKSAFCGHVVLMVVGGSGGRRGGPYVSLEMPAEDVMDRLACNMATVPYDKVRKHTINEDEWNSLTKAYASLASLPIPVDDRGETRALSLVEIRAELMRQKQLLAQDGVEMTVAVVDYVQLMDWKKSTTDRGSKYDGLDEIGKGLKRLAAELQIALLVPAQLNKEGKIRDCPAIAMHAQNHWNLVLAEADDPTAPRPVKIEVKKQRHGPRGEASTWFEGRYLRFSDKGGYL